VGCWWARLDILRDGPKMPLPGMGRLQVLTFGVALCMAMGTLSIGLAQATAAGKLGRFRGQLTSFGRRGRVDVRCGAPAHGLSLTAMTVGRERTGPDRVAAVMTCEKSGNRHQRAGICSSSGRPVPALAPNGTGPLPWNGATVDAKYTPNGKLMLLRGWRIKRFTRLNG